MHQHFNLWPLHKATIDAISFGFKWHEEYYQITRLLTWLIAHEAPKISEQQTIVNETSHFRI